MASPQSAPIPNPLDEALADARNTAKEQLQAASQLQLDRVMEQLSSGWHTQVEQVFSERLGDLASQLDAYYRARYQADLERAQAKARRELSNQLNQSARRLRQFTNETHWSQALVESTGGLCDRAALFVINQGHLELRALRGLTGELTERVPLTSAPAFASAVETKDPVVALRTRGELSESIAGLTGEAEGLRFHLFPILASERVAAILYADTDNGNLDVSALELLAAFGSTVIGGLTSSPRSAKAPELHTIFGIEPPAPRPTSWLSLGKDEQDIHIRAQRFARVQAAEMRLYKSQAVKDGRAGRNLYTLLQQEIDAARETFRKDYLSSSQSMVDYLHLELVRTLANEDADLLGPEYPGPLAV